jgi:hypothetical protein
MQVPTTEPILCAFLLVEVRLRHAVDIHSFSLLNVQGIGREQSKDRNAPGDVLLAKIRREHRVCIATAW